MKAQTLLSLLAVSAAVYSFTGCSSPEPPPAFEPTNLGGGEVQTKAVQKAYANGPFGVGKGSVIPNMSFIGYANAVANPDTMQLIEFADFYNPHGRDPAYQPAAGSEDDRLFGLGSQYGEGTPKPTVLAVTVSSVWCGPCNAEAKCLTPVHKRTYGPCGGGFFVQLQDGNDPGTAATPKNLNTWAAKTYKEDFPTAIDPAGRLINTTAPTEAFPVNLLIDTTTMTIVDAQSGIPDSKFWQQYEKLLKDTSCSGVHEECTSNEDCAAIKGTTCSTTCPQNAFLCIKNTCQASGCKNQ